MLKKSNRLGVHSFIRFVSTEEQEEPQLKFGDVSERLFNLNERSSNLEHGKRNLTVEKRNLHKKSGTG